MLINGVSMGCLLSTHRGWSSVWRCFREPVQALEAGPGSVIGHDCGTLQISCNKQSAVLLSAAQHFKCFQLSQPWLPAPSRRHRVQINLLKTHPSHTDVSFHLGWPVYSFLCSWKVTLLFLLNKICIMSLSGFCMIRFLYDKFYAFKKKL